MMSQHFLDDTRQRQTSAQSLEDEQGERGDLLINTLGMIAPFAIEHLLQLWQCDQIGQQLTCFRKLRYFKTN